MSLPTLVSFWGLESTKTLQVIHAKLRASGKRCLIVDANRLLTLTLLALWDAPDEKPSTNVFSLWNYWMSTQALPKDAKPIVKTSQFDIVVGFERLRLIESRLVCGDTTPHVLGAFREMLHCVAVDYAYVLVDIGEDSCIHTENALLNSDFYLMCFRKSNFAVQVPLFRARAASWRAASPLQHSSFLGHAIREQDGIRCTFFRSAFPELGATNPI